MDLEEIRTNKNNRTIRTHWMCCRCAELFALMFCRLDQISPQSIVGKLVELNWTAENTGGDRKTILIAASSRPTKCTDNQSKPTSTMLADSCLLNVAQNYTLRKRRCRETVAQLFCLQWVIKYLKS